MAEIYVRECKKCGVEKEFKWKEISRWMKNNPDRQTWDYLCKSCGPSERGTHRSSKTVLHNRWKAMHARTRGQGHHNNEKIYVSKGITICKEWMTDFPAFQSWSIANGFSIDKELDRIDNDKGYSPDNCQWLTGSDHRKKHWKNGSYNCHYGNQEIGIIQR